MDDAALRVLRVLVDRRDRAMKRWRPVDSGSAGASDCRHMRETEAVGQDGAPNPNRSLSTFAPIAANYPRKSSCVRAIANLNLSGGFFHFEASSVVDAAHKLICLKLSWTFVFFRALLEELEIKMGRRDNACRV